MLEPKIGASSDPIIQLEPNPDQVGTDPSNDPTPGLLSFGLPGVLNALETAHLPATRCLSKVYTTRVLQFIVGYTIGDRNADR